MFDAQEGFFHGLTTSVSNGFNGVNSGFYSRLKDEARFFILDHLDDLKKAKKDAALSSDEVKVMAFDEEIHPMEIYVDDEAKLTLHGLVQVLDGF
ncbi:uncharacterized protein LOC131220576 [Magnolia sinica]|uniref:uncharacterized protein LOC131220576 n=1 Tax=Magnolia sinica TaxID=86752 RepID=UPI002658530C|nr:uncharacterized protein LOC131220576 [Magnolia sinica]